MSAFNFIIGSNAVFPKAAANGIQVDQTTPTFPWVDWHGMIIPDIDGANRPAITEFRTGVFEYAYDAADRLSCDITYHMTTC